VCALYVFHGETSTHGYICLNYWAFRIFWVSVAGLKNFYCSYITVEEIIFPCCTLTSCFPRLVLQAVQELPGCLEPRCYKREFCAWKASTVLKTNQYIFLSLILCKCMCVRKQFFNQQPGQTASIKQNINH